MALTTRNTQLEIGLEQTKADVVAQARANESLKEVNSDLERENASFKNNRSGITNSASSDEINRAYNRGLADGSTSKQEIVAILSSPSPATLAAEPQDPKDEEAREEFLIPEHFE
jgi:hypothetical protein